MIRVRIGGTGNVDTFETHPSVPDSGIRLACRMHNDRCRSWPGLAPAEGRPAKVVLDKVQPHDHHERCQAHVQ